MIVLALGSNLAGNWGRPDETLAMAIGSLKGSPLCNVVAQSSCYITAGVGPGRPDDFANGVVLVETHLPPEALLRFLKRQERSAGVRSALPWGPRSLDLDIIDYRGRVAGWRDNLANIQRKQRLGRLTLPHPMAHIRAFVLEPLTEICPDWRHPVLRLTARQLLNRISDSPAGRVIEKLD